MVVARSNRSRIVESQSNGSLMEVELRRFEESNRNCNQRVSVTPDISFVGTMFRVHCRSSDACAAKHRVAVAGTASALRAKSPQSARKL